MRHEGKDAVTVRWYSAFDSASTVYSGGTGEAETLCQEDAKASCCAEDEGRSFGAAL